MNTIKLIIAVFLLACNSIAFAEEKKANVVVMCGGPAVEVDEIILDPIKVGEEIDCVCGLYNKGTSAVEIRDIKISRPELTWTPKRTTIAPEMIMGFFGKLKFKSAVGDYTIKVRIYYKNITEPTVITFKGKVTN